MSGHYGHRTIEQVVINMINVDESDIVEAVRANKSPEEVFTDDELKAWARRNYYIHIDEVGK